MKILVLLFILIMHAPAVYAEVWGSAKSRIYHYRLCRWNAKIKREYKVSFISPAAALKAGYQPCGKCRPPSTAGRDRQKAAEKEPSTHNSY